MDGFHFDALTLTLTTAGSRRRALTGLLSCALSLVGARAEETGAKNCKKITNKAKRKKCLARTKRCVPNCDRKICGADGCGGSCGMCAGDEVCQSGRCVCVPACGGKDCGDDGCGDSCGSCSAPLTCQGGLCACPRDVPDFCGGDCVPACGAAAPEVRNPVTCTCCTPRGVRCDFPAAQCCAGQSFCFGDGFDDVCSGWDAGEQCDFDEQCKSGSCRDSGLQVGTCA